MKRNLRFLIGTAVAALTCALPSCIDYSEELILNPDLSGTMTGSFTLSEMLSAQAGSEGQETPFSKEAFEEDMSGQEGIRIESVESFKEAGKLVLRYRLSFSSIEQAAQEARARAAESASAAAEKSKSGDDEDEGQDQDFGEVFGGITITREGKKVVFERTVSMDNDEDKDKAEKDKLGVADFGAAMLQSMLANNFFTYKTTFPGEVFTANSTVIDKETNTVTWKYSLAQLSQGPITMKAEFASPSGGVLPWWVILLVVGGLIAAVAGYINRRPASTPAPAAPPQEA